MSNLKYFENLSGVTESQFKLRLHYIKDLRILDNLHDQIYQRYIDCMEQVKAYGPKEGEDDCKPGKLPTFSMTESQYMQVLSQIKRYERLIGLILDRKTEIVLDQFVNDLFV